jgi:hypothetical protein
MAVVVDDRTRQRLGSRGVGLWHVADPRRQPISDIWTDSVRAVTMVGGTLVEEDQ